MGKKHKVVRVPDADDMEDENFLRHIEKRHATECQIEGYMARNNLGIWVPMYRTFHDRLHRLAVPRQYDHEHEDDF